MSSSSPASTEEVVAIVKAAAKHDAPIIPFGVGTSLEGHVAALEGGVTIDLSQMNQVIEVNAEDLDVTVAGRRDPQGSSNAYLRDTGLFFPIDPGADATLGGMAATRACGTNAVRYGTMRENVLGLTVVLADGRVIRTGGRARKSAAGYDLTRLFVGSEGTLGIITEVRLRLYGVPETMAAARRPVPDASAMRSTRVIRTIQSGIPVARIELVDEVQMRALHPLFQARLSEAAGPVLRVPRHRSRRQGTGGDGRRAIGRRCGIGGFRWTREGRGAQQALGGPAQRALLARLALRPGARVLATDACVPISRLADCILETRKRYRRARRRWRRSSAMSATAISTSPSCSIPTARTR